MADQALAQTGALKDPVGPRPVADTRYTLRYKLAWRWRVCCCWARYLSIAHHRNARELTDFVLDNHFFNASQVRGELVALAETLAQLRPDRALEIGTFRGGTLLLLTRLASPHATVVSVDLPGGKFGGGYSTHRRRLYRHFARRDQRLHLLQGDSHSKEMFERVKVAFENKPLDYLFIDGDHTYEGVKKDFQMYAPFVRKGGIIALHDIAEHPPSIGCEVSRLWSELKLHYRHEEIIQDRAQGWAGIGILYQD
ncbi:MAG TPA: class I SAM-dependent methyltransferase [Acidobacteriaceae bacterium]|nr:class I SAM-dependent methyltransferase [Acidobacteriaceae bacterium]